MSHAATFDLTDELATLFQREVTSEPTLSCVHVAIEDEKFTVANTVPLGATAEADFEAAKRLLSEDAAAYILFRLLRGGEKQPWSLMSYVPDTAPVKQKMLYANAKDTLRKKLPGDAFGQESHWSAMDEVAMTSAAATSDGSLLTETERLVLHEDMQASAEAAAGKVKSAGLAFPLVAEASAKVDEFSKGSAALVVLEIINEQIVLKGSGPAAAASDVQAALPSAEPSYCLFRWGGDKKVVFIFTCPDDAPVRGKMLHASSKASMLEGLQAFGISVDKSLEINDPADVTEQWLTTEVHGEAQGSSGAAATITAKAAPRGGRKLTKKAAS